MKTTINSLLLGTLIIISIFTGCIDAPPETTTKTDVAIARETIQLLGERNYQEAYANFDATVQSQITVTQLEEQLWMNIIQTYGEFEGIISTRETNESGYHVVYVTMEFSVLGALDARVVFADEPLIAGLQFVPTDQSTEYQAPDYADASLFNESTVTIGSDPWQLPGTLSLPNGDGPFPAVVLVHGSGQNDQDETIGPNKPLKDLAWGLASNGVAVLRYEKRTKYYAQQLSTMLYNFTVWEETINDAVAAVEYLSGLEMVNTSRLFVLGHSLGGMLAPRIAEQEPRIDGLIMLAAPTRQIPELYLDQIIYLADLDGERTDEEQSQIEQTQEQVEKILTLNMNDTEILLGGSLAYWTDLASYNQTATAQNLTIPLLIIQGTYDYQVTMDDDFSVWNRTFSDTDRVTLRSYETLNHLFMESSYPPTNEDYLIPNNVNEQVVIDIAEWITQQ